MLYCNIVYVNIFQYNFDMEFKYSQDRYYVAHNNILNILKLPDLIYKLLFPVYVILYELLNTNRFKFIIKYIYELCIYLYTKNKCF